MLYQRPDTSLTDSCSENAVHSTGKALKMAVKLVVTFDS